MLLTSCSAAASSKTGGGSSHDPEEDEGEDDGDGGSAVKRTERSMIRVGTWRTTGSTASSLVRDTTGPRAKDKVEDRADDKAQSKRRKRWTPDSSSDLKNTLEFDDIDVNSSLPYKWLQLRSDPELETEIREQIIGRVGLEEAKGNVLKIRAIVWMVIEWAEDLSKDHFNTAPKDNPGTGQSYGVVCYYPTQLLTPNEAATSGRFNRRTVPIQHWGMIERLLGEMDKCDGKTYEGLYD
ncbi:hypothetical protein CDD83_5690 [Cordyceps sp. RAO-2017]|nr:hypothetical protein CDD83_5690 [Cordyceps sp. RAO-2017]